MPNRGSSLRRGDKVKQFKPRDAHMRLEGSTPTSLEEQGGVALGRTVSSPTSRASQASSIVQSLVQCRIVVGPISVRPGMIGVVDSAELELAWPYY